MINKIKELKKSIDEARFQIEREQTSGNLQKVAELKYGDVPNLLKKLRGEERKLSRYQKSHPILKEEVGEEDIAKVISRWTGIPLTRLIEEEVKKLEKMEDILKKRVVGQEEAIRAISNAIRRSRAGISEENRPLGSFMFLGPTGVGKTETAKTLAEFLFSDENALIRLDMSEYMEKHTVSRMVGSPPGYVGYEEGGQLTEKIRRRPYSVVLLDEIEKAHPEVFNMLLQILEDGRLTDAKGRVASFKNAIIIMTSNIGSQFIAEMNPLGFLGEKSDDDRKKSVRDKVTVALKEHFPPEFLNRVDDVIIFDYLGKEEIKKIVELEIEKVASRLSRKGIALETTEKAKELLVLRGFDASLGARPLRRVIQRAVLNPLALKIVSGEIGAGGKAVIDVAKGEFVVQSVYAMPNVKQKARLTKTGTAG